MPLRSIPPALLAVASSLAGCGDRHPPPILAEPPPSAGAASAIAVPAEPVEVRPPAPPTVGLDDAPGKRERLATAVVLFGTAGDLGAETLRFVPVLCSIQGKVATGKVCGEVMPARTRVRLTRPGPGAPGVVTVARSTRDVEDTSGSRVFHAPLGPECCMYNTCAGETIPYLVVPPPRTAPQALLAVWPATADVDLRPRPRGVDPSEIPDSPWLGSPGARAEQGVRAGARRLIAGRKSACLSCAELWSDDGRGWAPVAVSTLADGYDVLATTDVDGDGRPEAIVYAKWRNDYGLHALIDDWTKVAYGYSCGNI